VTSSGTYILLYTVFSNTLRLCSSLEMREDVPYPYKTRGKIIIIYIFIFMVLDGRWKDKKFLAAC
jgi:hypothetical protein